MNQRLVLDHLLRRPLATRAQLAAALHMSQPTAGKVIADLLAAGVIEEVHTPAAGSVPAAGDRHTAGDRAVVGAAALGRPGRMLRVESATPRFLLVQLGVRHTRLAAAPLAAVEDDRWPIRFATGNSTARWLAQVQSHRAALGLDRPWAVLVSAAGVVDEDAGRILFSPNLHSSEGLEVVEGLAAMWPAPVCVVQEIRALALGHMLTSGADDFLLADFGDGVGGAAVIGGRLYQAPLPLSGELGHTPVPGNRRRCGCGGRGCLETLAGRRGLLHSFAMHHHVTRPRWADLVAHVQERGAPRWLLAAMAHAGVGIAGAINVLGLRRVVVTGMVGDLGPLAQQALAEAVEQASMWRRLGEVEVTFAPRHRAAGLVAAGLDRIVSPLPQWHERRGETA